MASDEPLDPQKLAREHPVGYVLSRRMGELFSKLANMYDASLLPEEMPAR